MNPQVSTMLAYRRKIGRYGFRTQLNVNNMFNKYAIDLRPSAAERIEGAPDSNPEAVTVYGRLGQWIALQDSGTGPDSAHSAGSGAPRVGLWIKVEVAPQPGSE